MRIQSESNLLKWLIWLGIFLFVITLTVLSFFIYHLSYSSKEADVTYEIEYAGPASEVFSSRQGRWLEAKRGDIVHSHDKLRTTEGEINFKVPEKIRFRLKNNSELKLGGVFQNGIPVAKTQLLKGILLGAAEHNLKKEDGAQVQISNLHANIQRNSFQMIYEPKADQGMIRVLGGNLTVQAKTALRSKVVNISSLHKIDFRQGAMSQPVRVSKEEWDQMKEAYELIAPTTASEVKQMDLSKQAGNFFQYVFDHGTFYSSKLGFSEREFIKDDAGGVYLEVRYDVFAPTSLVGVYLKIRGLDLSQFEGLEFDARRAPAENFPSSFTIEMKSQGSTLKVFTEKDISYDWKKISLPLHMNTLTSLSEMTFVFTHDGVGPNKKGAIQFKNFTLKTFRKQNSSKVLQAKAIRPTLKTQPKPKL